MIIENATVSLYNEYKGGVFQQAASVVTDTSMCPTINYPVLLADYPLTEDQQAYELTGNIPSIYGMQYKPGFDNAVRFRYHLIEYGELIGISFASTSLG